MAKSIVMLLLGLVFTCQSFASTCVFSGFQGSGNVAVCTLPPLDVNQCVSYNFVWQYSGTVNATVLLGSSPVFPATLFTPDNSFGSPNTWELKGKVCNVTQTQQFSLNSPVVRDLTTVTTPGSLLTTEDTSAGSTLTFVLSGQRGFGNPNFLGGTVEVH